MRVCIIGNGIAGINTAAALRQAASAAGITAPSSAPDASGRSDATSLSIDVFASEPLPFYSRVRLPEVLSGSAKPEDIAFYKPDWYEKRGITVRLSSPVASIDTVGKTLALADGRVESWDALVLATGASSNRPGIPGADSRGVFTLRTMQDALAIRSHVLANPSSASVIGGGLLGLEAARALKDAGAQSVRVFELFPRLLPRQLDETGASLLAARFRAMGIEIVCGAETARLEPGMIVLKDGRSFESRTTLLSMGVHSNIALAVAAGLAVKRGIVVDERMRTSASDVYAVGDCAEFGGIVWGIIPAALEQAPVAAKQIASVLSGSNDAPAYVQTVPKTALKIADIELMSVGKAVPTEEEAAAGCFEMLLNVWSGGSRYEKYVLAPDVDPEAASKGAYTLVGAILYGSKVHQSYVQSHIGKIVGKAEIAALLEE